MAMLTPLIAVRRVDNLHPPCCHAREGGHPVNTNRPRGTRWLRSGRQRSASACRAIAARGHARPHVRPHRRGLERADRAQGRPRDLPHHGLHHVRQPGDPRESRHGSWRGVRRHLPRRGALDRHHGALRQLPHRACPWHGAQRLFRLHHGARARRQLAARARRRIPLRRRCSCYLGHAVTRMADQCDTVH